jgi:flagellar motor switch protein FliM
MKAMKGVLDQSQIDTLLRDISGGNVEIKKAAEQKAIKEYDFRIPRKFTKEQLRIISGIHETYARLLSSYLTGALRTFCKAEVVSIEETRYYEYANAMPESVLLGILDLNPYPGTVVMSLSKELAFTVIDKLLGGSGDYGIMGNEYTDIEIVIMERIYKNIIVYFKDAWANTAEVNPVLRKFGTDSSTNVMHLDEIVVIVVLNVTIKENTGKITVCLPYMWLEAISDKLSAKYKISDRVTANTESEASKQAMILQLYKTPIDISVNLGNSRVYINDIINMEIGDIIKLNQKIGDNVKVNLGGKTWFYGQLGINNKKKAVKIVESAV